MGGLTLPERGLMFNLNFNYNVFTVFAEAELFEFLGFKIPKIIKESTEKWAQLHADLTSVGYMLNEYTDIIETLSVPEVNFCYLNFFLFLEQLGAVFPSEILPSFRPSFPLTDLLSPVRSIGLHSFPDGSHRTANNLSFHMPLRPNLPPPPPEQNIYRNRYQTPQRFMG